MVKHTISDVKILGIVNITEDSFSDGGLYLNPQKAIEHAYCLYEEGADIADLGPASSHPDAKQVSPQEEIQRLEPVIDHLQASGKVISVDSFHPETQLYALSRGVEYLNDIQGFPHQEIYPQLATGKSKLIMMHSVQGRGKATRVVSSPETILLRIEEFFTQRLEVLESTGIERERIILDPGMGFFLGSNPEPSLIVLQNIQYLREKFQLPILISVSRKSFLGRVTQRLTQELGAASLAAELYAVSQKVDYIRTHNVKALRDASLIWSNLENPIK